MIGATNCAARTLLAGVAAMLVAACSPAAPARAARVATGLASHTLCVESFISGQDPAQVRAESLAPMPGIRLIDWAMREEVDAKRGEVRSSLFGGFERRAVYHPGWGCRLVDGAPPAMPDFPPVDTAPPPFEIAGPAVVEPADPRLKLALDHAFAEPAGGPPRQTKAVVVLQNGRVIAERYAPGYGIDTPMLGWSLTKSVTSALVGILVRQGRLAVDLPAPVAAWAAPDDPRHAITVDMLLRMTSGLDLDETNTGFDASSQTVYLAPDMAAAAAAAPLKAAPGNRWHYSSPSTLLLDGIIRDLSGGDAAAVLRFARAELFEPLGMRQVTLEFDQAGTPIGSTYMLASARDWARFGLLYLNDGVIGGRRILPADWVDYSARPTAQSDEGYAAGFWTNRGNSADARGRVRRGMPADSFFASGSLGQRIAVLPSQHLVVVRLGRSQDWPNFDFPGFARLVIEVAASLAPRPGEG